MADEELADRRAGDAGTPSRNESPYNVRVVRAIPTPLSRLEVVWVKNEEEKLLEPFGKPEDNLRRILQAVQNFELSLGNGATGLSQALEEMKVVSTHRVTRLGMDKRSI